MGDWGKFPSRKENARGKLPSDLLELRYIATVAELIVASALPGQSGSTYVVDTGAPPLPIPPPHGGGEGARRAGEEAAQSPPNGRSFSYTARESRGLNYNLDYPNPSPEWAQRDTVLRKTS